MGRKKWDSWINYFIAIHRSQQWIFGVTTLAGAAVARNIKIAITNLIENTFPVL
jgi:hypothetical protein